MGDLRVCEQGYSRFSRDALVFARVSVKALVSTSRKNGTDNIEASRANGNNVR